MMMTDTCEKHCEATAFKIVIRGLEGEVARLVAAKTWVGLSEQDINELKFNLPDLYYWVDVVRATEKRLKEKNT
jgi:hypothetical protein